MQEPTFARRKDILVVDDVPAIRTLLADFLHDKGYNTATAGTLHDAQALLASDRFSLVITNLQLDRAQQKSGCEVVKRAKSNSPPLPVIVITGGATSETIAYLAKLGTDVFLSKPVALDQLHRLVRELLLSPASA